MGIGLVNESFISKEASEAHKVCLQSLMTVQHRLKVYIELICQFLCQLSKKSVARDRVQPPLATHYVPYVSSDFVSETGYAKNRIQYTDVNKWAVLFTEL